MTINLRLGTTVFMLASLAFAATPAINVNGNYIEARTADVYTGPCFANSEVGLTGNLAVFGWKIDQGSWNGVTLDGLSVVAAIHASDTLGAGHAYPVKAVLMVDENADLVQRQALREFARRMSGDLLQDIVRIEAVPIAFTVEGSIHSATATLTAGTLAAIRTRALQAGDHICHNEEAFYAPLTQTDHAMPAYTLDNDFQGQGLNARWKSPSKRSAFVATFHLTE